MVLRYRIHFFMEENVWNGITCFSFNSALLGVGLAMDAFSVSLANGLNEPRMRSGRMCAIAGVFAGFQALMPCWDGSVSTPLSAILTLSAS